MATLATLFNWFVGSTASDAARQPAAQADLYALRAIANEDVYFFVKDINNSRVVRESDPRARRVCWKLIAYSATAAVMLICVLLPSAYGLLAGYQVESLKQDQARLTALRNELELEEARLLSPARLEELARAQLFDDPPPNTVVHLEGQGSLALNVKK
jgi:hypothetical protein